MKIDLKDLGQYHIGLNIVIDGREASLDDVRHDNAQQFVDAITRSNSVKLRWIRTNGPVIIKGIPYDKLNMDINYYPPHRRPAALKKGKEYKICWRAQHAGRTQLRSQLTKEAQDELDRAFEDFLVDIHKTAIEQLRANAFNEIKKIIMGQVDTLIAKQTSLIKAYESIK